MHCAKLLVKFTPAQFKYQPGSHLSPRAENNLLRQVSEFHPSMTDSLDLRPLDTSWAPRTGAIRQRTPIAVQLCLLPSSPPFKVSPCTCSVSLSSCAVVKVMLEEKTAEEHQRAELQVMLQRRMFLCSGQLLLLPGSFSFHFKLVSLALWVDVWTQGQKVPDSDRLTFHHRASSSLWAQCHLTTSPYVKSTCAPCSLLEKHCFLKCTSENGRSVNYDVK